MTPQACRTGVAVHPQESRRGKELPAFSFTWPICRENSVVSRKINSSLGSLRVSRFAMPSACQDHDEWCSRERSAFGSAQDHTAKWSPLWGREPHAAIHRRVSHFHARPMTGYTPPSCQQILKGCSERLSRCRASFAASYSICIKQW